jgi:hypothetical protein
VSATTEVILFIVPNQQVIAQDALRRQAAFPAAASIQFAVECILNLFLAPAFRVGVDGAYCWRVAQ